VVSHVDNSLLNDLHLTGSSTGGASSDGGNSLLGADHLEIFLGDSDELGNLFHESGGLASNSLDRSSMSGTSNSDSLEVSGTSGS